MPALRKDRGQTSTQLPYENTVQFNTFINVSIPKASQPLSEEALQLRPTIPAKTPVESPLATASAFLSLRKLALGELKDNSHTRKKPVGHINRPPNAFILFRRAQCFKMSGSSGSHQQRISNLAASFWRSLTHAEQSAWYALAQDVKKFHQLLFPDYQFIPHPQNATEEEKHRKTNLSAQPPSTAEQDVVIEEEMSAYIFLHAGVHVDLAEVERLQRVEDSVAPKPSKKGRSQRQNIQTTALPAGSTFIFTLSDPPSTTSSEQSSHPSTPCSTQLDVNVPADASATELQPQSQYTTQDLVGWNPNYSLAYSGESTPATENPTTVDPLATIINAPPSSTTTGSPSLGPVTPEPYLGYFESQMGYEMNMCDALTTHRECISHLPESSSLPGTWDPQGQHDPMPVIADALTYPFGQAVQPYMATGVDMQTGYELPLSSLPYRFSVQFREWTADDAWCCENNIVNFVKPSAADTEVRPSTSPLPPYPAYPPTYIFS